MIFRRALQREFAQTAAAVFVALFAILISTVLIRLLGQAAGGRVPPDAVVALIGFGALAQLPTVLTLTLFIAILVSLSRSYRDSEMVVWFASGVPLTAWIRPVLMFALPVVLVAGGGSLYLTPWSQQKSAEYRERLENRDDTHRVAPGVFRESASAQRVFFVEVGAGEDGRVRNVFVSEQTRSGQLVVIASAEGYLRGDADGRRFVVLEKGRRYDGTPGTPEYRVMEFDRYEVQVEQRQVAGDGVPDPPGPELVTRRQRAVQLHMVHEPGGHADEDACTDGPHGSCEHIPPRKKREAAHRDERDADADSDGPFVHRAPLRTGAGTPPSPAQ